MTLATVAFVALTVELGNWQLRRADEKQARRTMLSERRLLPTVDLNGGEQVPAANLAWRQIRAQGVYLARDELLIDSRVHDHIPGYHVVDPLEVSGTRAVVLVNRGWMAARSDRVISAPPVPAGPVTVEGIAAVPLQAKLHFVKEVLPPPGAERVLWSNLDLEHYREATGLAVLPFVVEQTGAAADGLVRDWPAPPDDVPMHKAYALQWYTFACIALGLYVALNLRRRRAAGG